MFQHGSFPVSLVGFNPGILHDCMIDDIPRTDKQCQSGSDEDINIWPEVTFGSKTTYADNLLFLF